MMARLLGASSTGGFSTRPVTRTTSSPSIAGLLAPARPRRRRTCRCSPCRRRAARSPSRRARPGRRASARAGGRGRRSGRRRAAPRTARRRRTPPPAAPRGRAPWPRPAGRSAPARRRWTRAPTASRSASPFFSSAVSSSGCRSKKSSMAALLRPVTISTSGRPGAGGLLDDVLQGRAVDDRQQLLGHGLGGREEAGAHPGDGDDGLPSPDAAFVAGHCGSLASLPR